MGVMAYPLRYALADLALALSRAAEDPAEVRATAARAAADMIGDGAGCASFFDDPQAASSATRKTRSSAPFIIRMGRAHGAID